MTPIDETNCETALANAATAQADWARLGVRQRAAAMRRVQTRLAQQANDFCDLIHLPQRQSKTETLSAELLPLCEALRYLQRHAAEVLAPRKLNLSGRPIWLWGTRTIVQRAPLGRVLILAPWNYPILLAGVQAAQALVAGNAVLWKPAPGCEAVTAAVIDCFQAAVGSHLIQRVDSRPEIASQIIDAGVEKIVLTGSSQTGRRVLAAAADQLTPTTMELSGCDAMCVLPAADEQRVIEAVSFGLSFNSGATCIAPRRIFVHEDQLERFRKLFRQPLTNHPPLHVHPAVRQKMIDLVEDGLARGGSVVGGPWNRETLNRDGTTPPLLVFDAQPHWPLMSADLFAPVAAVCSYATVEELVDRVARAPYALAASIFGPVAEARKLADQIDVGTVTINDLIVPTADPRIPFGGRSESGFGTTRGREGLLEMTCPKVISTQSLRQPQHFAPRTAGDEAILAGMLQLKFAAGWRRRFKGLRQLIQGVQQSRKK